MLAVTGGMFAVFYFASLYVQQTLGFTPVQAGLAFLPLTAGIILFSFIAQQLIGRIGVLPVALTGMFVAAIGLLLLSQIPVDGSYASNVLPGILVMSAGLGLTFVPMTLIATTGVADDDAGLASGLFNSSQQIGGALGLAILSTVAASTTSNSRPGGAPDAGRALLGPGRRLPGGVRRRRRAHARRGPDHRAVRPAQGRRRAARAGHRARRCLNPLRSDARRNRELILAAASELFSESGADLSIDELARRAGVGHATIFRRFPCKDDLILAMIEQRLADLAEAVEEAAESDDAWEGLAAAMAAHRRAPGRGPRPVGRGPQPGGERAQPARGAARGSSRPSPTCCAGRRRPGQVRDDLDARGRVLPDRGGGQRVALPLPDPRALAALPRGGAGRDAARGRIPARPRVAGALRDRGRLRGGRGAVGRDVLLNDARQSLERMEDRP